MNGISYSAIVFLYIVVAAIIQMFIDSLTGTAVTGPRWGRVLHNVILQLIGVGLALLWLGLRAKG